MAKKKPHAYFTRVQERMISKAFETAFNRLEMYIVHLETPDYVRNLPKKRTERIPKLANTQRMLVKVYDRLKEQNIIIHDTVELEATR